MTDREKRILWQNTLRSLDPSTRARLGLSTSSDRFRIAYSGFCSWLGSFKIQFFMIFLVMFTLKLAKIFAASWWLVTAPLWAPLALVLSLPLLFLGGAVVCLVILGISWVLVKLFGFVTKPFRPRPLKLG